MTFDDYLDEHSDLANDIANLLDEGLPYATLEVLYNHLMAEQAETDEKTCCHNLPVGQHCKSCDDDERGDQEFHRRKDQMIGDEDILKGDE